MDVWYIGRHAASLAWLKAQRIRIDQELTHLDNNIWPKSGDIVIGNLPVQWIAELTARGIFYMHLTLDVPVTARGNEFNPEDLASFNIRIQAFTAAVSDNTPSLPLVGC